MKVLQITAHYLPSPGGVQSFVHNLGHSLAEHGHNVKVLTINTVSAPVDEVTPSGVQIHRCRLDYGYHRGVYSNEFIKQIFSARDHDLYHIHIPFHFGLEASVLASKRNHVPLIVTHHGQGIEGGGVYSIIARLYCCFYRAISLYGVDKLIFLTKSYSQSLWLPKAVRNKVKIVPTGADIQSFNPNCDGSIIRHRFNITEPSPLLLFVGYLGLGHRYKGVDYLICAMAEIRKIVPDARLLIVGGGDWLPQLKTLTRELGLDRWVIFSGPVENSCLPEYYAAANVVVLPSIRGPENSPVVVFEAMASAKPVIATNLPGVRNIVQHGETGLLVEPKNVHELSNAIIKAITDGEFQKTAGLMGRIRAESYSWDKCADDIEKIYMEFVP